MTQTTVPHLSDLQFEHKLWLNELKFSEEEIKIFEKQMESLISRKYEMERMAQLERFQNQFILQINVINDLKNEIRRHQNYLKELMKARQVDSSDLRIDYQNGLREKTDQFRILFNHLKKEFFEFILPW